MLVNTDIYMVYVYLRIGIDLLFDMNYGHVKYCIVVIGRN